MKRNTLAILTALLIGVALWPLTTSAQHQRGGGTTPLDPVAKAVLIDVLAGANGEYAARATYQAIVDAFGPVQPYANILEAEKKHVDALVQQCLKYGVPTPEDRWPGVVTAPPTLLEAAQAGVDAEVLNVVMYEVWLDDVKNYPSLAQVFTNLRDASLLNHLPAFEAALENGGSLP